MVAEPVQRTNGRTHPVIRRTPVYLTRAEWDELLALPRFKEVVKPGAPYTPIFGEVDIEWGGDSYTLEFVKTHTSPVEFLNWLKQQFKEESE